MKVSNLFRLINRTITLKLRGIRSDPICDYDTAAATYDQYYSRYLGQCADQLLGRLPLQRGMRILDLACGTGFFSHRIADRIGSDGYLAAVDLSGGMLQRNREAAAEKGLRNIDFVEMDALQYLRGLKDASFDGVVCGWGICYMDHAPLERELKRVVRPGGFVGLIENRACTLKAVSALFRQTLLQHPQALAKDMVIKLPKDHRYLRKAFCRGALSADHSWDSNVVIPCRSGSEVVDYMLKSGASAGFINALDSSKIDEVMREFARIVDERFRRGQAVPVVHEYCALLATRA